MAIKKDNISLRVTISRDLNEELKEFVAQLGYDSMSSYVAELIQREVNAHKEWLTLLLFFLSKIKIKISKIPISLISLISIYIYII